jgi:hypothetical protein
MRWWLKLFMIGLSLLLFVLSATVWFWTRNHVVTLQSDLRSGHYDGDKSWRGSYMVAGYGQVVFEQLQITYSAKPTTAPSTRWEAEDAVWITTPALRGFPVRDPTQIYYQNEVTKSKAGELRQFVCALPFAFICAITLLPVVCVILATLVRWAWPRRQSAART